MKTRFYISFILIMLFIAAIYLVLLIGFVTYFVMWNESDSYFWIGVAVGLIGLYVFIRFALGFRYVFPRLEITSKGFSVSSFFGLMPKRFYEWSSLDGYCVRDLGFDDFVGFKVYSITSQGTTIVEFHDFFYYNMDEFYDKLRSHLDQLRS